MSDDTIKTHGKIWATAHYAGKEVALSNNETQIEVRTFASTPAVVKVAYGLTLNLGNYESARIDAGVELPCYPQEVTAAFKEAWELCQEEIQTQVKSLRSKDE